MDVEGWAFESRRGRGHREEPVRSILSTPIPPSIILSILNMNFVFFFWKGWLSGLH